MNHAYPKESNRDVGSTMYRIVLAALMLVTGLLQAASSAAGADVARKPDAADTATGPQVRFRIPEHDLYPESIAFDSQSGDFFLSSMGRPRILRIHADGTYEDFPSGKIPGLASSIGMKVDTSRRALWVCTGRFSLLDDHDATPARTGVLRFDLDTGKLTGSWMLDQEQEGPYHIFNDLVLTARGDAYATTTLLGRLYRIQPGAEAMELVQQLEPGSHNNGIALGPRQESLFVTVDRKIHRLDLATGRSVALEVPDDQDRGTDGLYYYKGSLISIKPRSKTISRLYLDDALAKVTRVETLVRDHPDLAYPTTGVLVGDALVYVATSFADIPRKDQGPQHPDVLIHELALH